MNDSSSRDTCEGRKEIPLDVLSLGELRREGEAMVWCRCVRKKNILRFLDAWTLNEPLLTQLRQARVSLLRYRAPEGLYEADLGFFAQEAARLPTFACGETVFALPRRKWQFTPSGEGQRMRLL